MTTTDESWSTWNDEMAKRVHPATMASWEQTVARAARPVLTDDDFETLKIKAQHAAELRGLTRYTVLVGRPEKAK